MYAAIDTLVDKLDRQVLRHKDRVKDHQSETLKRQQEIGIKRALGASKGRIFTELLSENWLTTVLGAIAGVGCALVLNQVLAQVISIPSLSWWLPLLTCTILLLCVTVATWYPAAIATRVSPATATKAL